MPPLSAPGEDILTEAEIDWERRRGGGKKVEARVLKVNDLTSRLKRKKRRARDEAVLDIGYC